MSSSSDLETRIVPKNKKKETKQKPKQTTADATKNEGDDPPHWAYSPPEGAVPLDHRVDSNNPFEWQTVKGDDDDGDTEIWLIRVPDAIKAAHLQGLEIDLPPSSSRTRTRTRTTTHIGVLTRKTASYDVWCIGDNEDEGRDGDGDGDGDASADVAGGEELRGLTCLLPRKRKKGKLYVAPRRVSRHIVVSARPAVPTPPEQHQSIIHTARASYPKDVLKHAFVPYGARSKQTLPEDASMDVDDVEITQNSKSLKDETKTKESKGKKRKGKGDSPKTSKKHKSNA